MTIKALAQMLGGVAKLLDKLVNIVFLRGAIESVR